MELLEVFLFGAVLGSTAFTIFLLMLPLRYDRNSNQGAKAHKTSVQVLVLGDIGRSPRMQNHSISIARHGGRVEIIGYKESDLHPDLLGNPLISITPIPLPPRFLSTGNRSLFILFGPLKVLWQIWSLCLILGYRTKPSEWMLVQNPPSIPTLAIAQAICFLRNTRLLIDWHNFGWSILALKLGEKHPLVRVSKWYESFFGRNATAHFTVSDAMARVLKSEYRTTSSVLTLHDRPPAHFQPLTPPQQSAFLHHLPESAPYAASIDEGKTHLIVSSTSWTADEDFSILLDALLKYSARARPRPYLVVIITGKGPQKEAYVSQIARLTSSHRLENVTILTAWLSIENYASLLASASLGVSLHMSSSGVDLPMKVVDMFGAGLPVAGWAKFKAWPELVQEGVNGRGFDSADGLADILEELLVGDKRNLAVLKQGAIREGEVRWDDEWNGVAGRLLGLCE